MNRNQTEGHANEASDKNENPDDESETVLGEINDDTGKQREKARPGSEKSSDNARKHGDKKGTVLGEVNDDDEKENE